ncbi:MAG TPA: hypothetical protein IAC41_06610 [Candidatus Merdenecus merdavium]|nr:hypothetical protein [Candidatus Merdenecus merdavium]
METLVRGYINTPNLQRSFYFEGTTANIANFILDHATMENEIEINTIFGKTIVSFNLKENKVCGRKAYVVGVESYLDALRKGTIKRTKVVALDLEDLNNVDEFDNIEVREEEFERCI